MSFYIKDYFTKQSLQINVLYKTVGNKNTKQTAPVTLVLEEGQKKWLLHQLFMFVSLSLVRWRFTTLTRPWRRRLKETRITPILLLFIFPLSCIATKLWPVTSNTFTVQNGRATQAAQRPPNNMWTASIK